MNDSAYFTGNAFAHLTKAGGGPRPALVGRLQVTNGWLVLSVPAALVRGVFDALHEPGAQLPETFGIPVISPQELDRLGGADKISERGHQFSYSLAGIGRHEPSSGGVSTVVILRTASPELRKLRLTYGLSPFPKGDSFQLPIAIRKTGVLLPGEQSKLAAALEEPDWQEYDQVLVKAAVAAAPVDPAVDPFTGLCEIERQQQEHANK